MENFDINFDKTNEMTRNLLDNLWWKQQKESFQVLNMHFLCKFYLLLTSESRQNTRSIATSFPKSMERDTCADRMILSRSNQDNHFLRVQGVLLQNAILSACHRHMSRSKIASYSIQKPWKN